MIRLKYKFNTEILFILSIVLLPILFLYATPISGLTIGDVLFVISVFLLLIKNKAKWQKGIVLLLIYVVLLTLIRFESLNSPTTSLRYIFYLLGISLISSVRRYKDIAIVLYRKISLFVVIFFIIQYLSYKILGIPLSGVLTFLPLTDDTLSDYGTVLNNSSGRCMSVFAEPSHFCIYVILYIAIELFYSKIINKKNVFLAVFSTLCLILSSSFTGILCAIFLWFLWFNIRLIDRQISFKTLFLVLLAVACLLIIVFNTSAGDYITNKEIYERQSEGRFSGFEFVNLLFNNVSENIWLFGNGMNDIAQLEYLSGWPRLLYYFGFFGSFLYVISFISCSRYRSFSFVILLLLAILMIGTEINFGCFIIPYMLFICLFKNSYYIK